MKKKLKDIGELKLIEMFKAAYKTERHTIVGVGDDAAVLRIPGARELLLLTCDTLVEGVHFTMKDTSGYQIGWKALGAGLSDIAAMGGRPVSTIVSLALPAGIKVSFTDGFTEGMNSLARRFNVDIVGGDTVSSPNAIVITVAVNGIVSKKNLVLRRGARVGDKILVTGSLGGSRYGKQFKFVPRIKEAQWLVRHGRINAMIDITDGLGIDLYRLINASRVGAVLYKEAIPISKDAYRTKDPLKSALYDGEDFELLLTTKDADKLFNKRVPLTVIGEITGARGRIKNLKHGGYEHFKRQSR